MPNIIHSLLVISLSFFLYIASWSSFLFVRWNAEDPVSQIEIQRNNIIEGAQGNRNPFIDNPYLATIIWGGSTAEDLWD